MINRTTRFLVPLIFPYNYIEYIDGYIGLNKLNDVEGKIYCVAKTVIPEKILLTIKNKSNYIGSTFVNNKRILILKIPEQYKQDYNMFLIGNYKSINKQTKRIIYKFWFDNYKQNDTFANITNNILYSLFDDDMIKEILTDNLSTTMKEFNDILEVLDKKNETESILKLTEEIYKTN